MSAVEEAADSGGKAWYVTNGERVVGPVATSTLLQAVALGQVAKSCFLWHEGLPAWRPLETIREVRAVGRAKEARGDDWVPSETWRPGGGPEVAALRATLWMDDAADESEVVALALQAIVLETRATVGFAHRPRRALGALETRAVFGAGGHDRLGCEVPADDEAMRIARLGTTVLDGFDPKVTMPVAAASRLAPGGVRGLALAPIYLGGRLFAVLEVAKDDRAFRRGDRSWMRAVVRAAAARMAS
jgi:hypothetical protein